MGVVILVLILLFGFIFSKVNTDETKSTPCTTFWNRPGDCVYFTKCPTILSIMDKANNTQEELDYLQNVSCLGPVEGYVCCDDEFDERGIKLLNNTENFETCGTFSDLKVINGQEINIHSRPWMALLGFRSENGISYRCGGTLITKKFVLTAAHCLSGDKRRLLIQVRLGEHHLSEARYCNRNHICERGHIDIGVKNAILHTGFNDQNAILSNGFNSQNDIALIKLARDVEYDEHIRPVCLPLSQELREKGQTETRFQVTGWGRTEKAYSSMVPLQAKVYRANCDSLPSTINPNTQICAGGGRNDSCAGDSGGPLTYPQIYYNYHRIVQFGIVSYGPSNCGSGTPAVYTNVAEYLSWISQNIIK